MDREGRERGRMKGRGELGRREVGRAGRKEARERERWGQLSLLVYDIVGVQKSGGREGGREEGGEGGEGREGGRGGE